MEKEYSGLPSHHEKKHGCYPVLRTKFGHHQSPFDFSYSPGINNEKLVIELITKPKLLQQSNIEVIKCHTSSDLSNSIISCKSDIWCFSA